MACGANRTTPCPSRAHTIKVYIPSLAREGGVYSIISFQRGELSLPPFENPHVFCFVPQKQLSAMGVQGGNAPLKILLKIKNKIPLPRPRG